MRTGSRKSVCYWLPKAFNNLYNTRQIMAEGSSWIESSQTCTSCLKSLPLLGSKKDCQDFYVHQLFHANPQVVAQQTLVQGSIISKGWLDRSVYLSLTLTLLLRMHNLHVTLLLSWFPQTVAQSHQSLFSRPRPIREKGVACESSMCVYSSCMLLLNGCNATTNNIFYRYASSHVLLDFELWICKL